VSQVHHSEDVWQVLRQFPIAIGAVEAVESDGFSGARLWRATDGERQYCLRRWPQGANARKVLLINQVLSRADLSFVPRPLNAKSGESLVAHAHHLWTLQPWMAGSCLKKLPPSRELLRHALQALAQFHRATVTPESDDEVHFEEGSSLVLGLWRGPPLGLKSRSELAAAYFKHDLQAIQAAHIPGHLAELRARRERLIPLFLEVAPRLLRHGQAALNQPVPLQPCIRDIHAGHVLFTGDQVTGLIDFDAMRLDTVATDLARLLASYCGDDFELWAAGLAAYDEIRPLSKDERDLVVHYDRFAVLLTGLQWLDWMLLEGKQFELSRVLPRIDATLARLEHLRNNLRIGDGGLVY